MRKTMTKEPRPAKSNTAGEALPPRSEESAELVFCAMITPAGKWHWQTAQGGGDCGGLGRGNGMRGDGDEVGGWVKDGGGRAGDGESIGGGDGGSGMLRWTETIVP